MLYGLFRREPQYDENGRVIGYSQPKIVWIILALIVFYFCKDKIMKQKGGADLDALAKSLNRKHHKKVIKEGLSFLFAIGCIVLIIAIPFLLFPAL